MNGANVKFVEDAARLLHSEFSKDKRIIEFKILLSHNESLHNHNAISLILSGDNKFFDSKVSVAELQSLVYWYMEVGDCFGKWTVIEILTSGRVKVQCKCGKIDIKRIYDLKKVLLNNVTNNVIIEKQKH